MAEDRTGKKRAHRFADWASAAFGLTASVDADFENIAVTTDNSLIA